MTSLHVFDLARALSGALWLWLIWTSSGGVYRIVTRKVPRFYDAIRNADVAVALHCLAFNASWLFYRDTLKTMTDNELHNKTALYSFSVVLVFILLVRQRVYERDCRDC